MNWHHYAYVRYAGLYRVVLYVNGEERAPRTWLELKAYTRIWWQQLVREEHLKLTGVHPSDLVWTFAYHQTFFTL